MQQPEGAAVTKRSQFTVSLPTAALLPPALENVLVARIDSLDEGPREVAQAAAIVGRRFSRRILDRLFGYELSLSMPTPPFS